MVSGVGALVRLSACAGKPDELHCVTSAEDTRRKRCAHLSPTGSVCV